MGESLPRASLGALADFVDQSVKGYNDVTSQRVAGTFYQNTSGKPLVLLVQTTLYSGTKGTISVLHAKIQISPDQNTAWVADLDSLPGPPLNLEHDCVLQCVVPDQWYYEVLTETIGQTGGNDALAQINQWLESY
jgi:hypothetical protein